jgi:hypothetical protein
MPEEGMSCEDDDCTDDAERLLTYWLEGEEKEEYLCEVHGARRLLSLRAANVGLINIVDYDADADQDEDEDDDEDDEDEESDEDVKPA